MKSYHAHIYFNEDNHGKAAILRRWIADRFDVELGHWNAEPRGPHPTPSFYFGFKIEQAQVIIPWLLINNLGLSILVHPNTDDPKADHMNYGIWLNDKQSINGFYLSEQHVDFDIFPNTQPTVDLE